MYNRVILLGYLGGDPVQRFNANGQPGAVSFSLAVNRVWTGNDGEKHEQTTWFNISVWGKHGESCSKYLHKGSKVLVEGRVEEPYAFAKDGGEVKATNQVTADMVRFLDPKSATEKEETLF